MNIDMTEQVRLWIANDEDLYNTVLGVVVDAYEDVLSMTDEENISYIADQIECEVQDFYLTGTETPAGDWLLRAALADVAWYQIATLEYADYLSDMGV